MKALKFSSFIFILLFIAGSKSITLAQNGPVLYFCEKYSTDGEEGIADRFTAGYLTIMIRCDYALGLKDCHIQYDKWNDTTQEFDYYKKFDFTVQPNMSYIYFSKTDNSDLSFDDPGIYRVFLLDNYNETVASSLIQIVSK